MWVSCRGVGLWTPNISHMFTHWAYLEVGLSMASFIYLFAVLNNIQLYMNHIGACSVYSCIGLST